MIKPARWLIPKRLIYAYAEGTTNLAELREHSQRVMALLNAGTRPVHILLESAPDHQIELLDLHSGLKSLGFVYHPSLGWAVHRLEGKHTMRLVSRLISRFARVSYQVVDTREEGLGFLRAMDETLDWAQVDDTVFYPQIQDNHQNTVSKQ